MQRNGQLVLVVGVVWRAVNGLAILQDRFFEIPGVDIFVPHPFGGGRLDEHLADLLQLLIGVNLVLRSDVVAQTAQSFGQLKVNLRQRLTQGYGLLELVYGMLPIALGDHEDADVVVNVVVIGLE